MKKTILLTTILSTVLCTNVLSANENQTLKISGKIDKGLKVQARVGYEAGKTALGCGHYNWNWTDLGYEWSAKSKKETFVATVDVDGNYSVTVNFKNKPFDFCKWEIGSFNLDILPATTTDLDRYDYFIYDRLDSGSYDTDLPLSDISNIACKLEDSDNEKVTRCKINDESDFSNSSYRYSLDFMNDGENSVNFDISLSN
ncbi:MAG: hypothetical protein A2381_10050 [Bdellovibrionales bacterium RIFOXYB1_FULL_37_110]|nr:MAG: hypothetical protein A2417_02565 [Bdellovibrionales bacterium RIFOXYC1_FULL_37_79]OFZ61107.1 MAG: hypothetical protein A2381_10050 [Bdellovibrionales bacterium RIFOXYB1_FULL_37_110]OFZ61614.1 MAG: hypothetical protein A2577_10530 [Bdellovibrionales bacterium RIFOXYD1_FULL_36_51]